METQRTAVRRPRAAVNNQMSIEELLALPVAFDLCTSNRALGIGRSVGYDLARRGEYPIRLLRLGAQYRITRADLLRYLGVEVAA